MYPPCEDFFNSQVVMDWRFPQRFSHFMDTGLGDVNKLEEIRLFLITESIPLCSYQQFAYCF